MMANNPCESCSHFGDERYCEVQCFIQAMLNSSNPFWSLGKKKVSL